MGQIFIAVTILKIFCHMALISIKQKNGAIFHCCHYIKNILSHGFNVYKTKKRGKFSLFPLLHIKILFFGFWLLLGWLWLSFFLYLSPASTAEHITTAKLGATDRASFGLIIAAAFLLLIFLFFKCSQLKLYACNIADVLL